MRKKLISLIIAVCMLFCMSIDAFAVPAVTGGFAGINNYSYCEFGNRAGASYVANLNSALVILDSLGKIDYTLSYMKKNNNVTVSNCTGSGATTIFAYSGHGIVYNTTANNALHVNYNSSQKSHSSLGEKTSTSINKLTTSTRFNHKYIILYTCNQLTNNGSTNKANNILKMMNGTRLICGFASTMYLDSREATRFVQNMEDMTIINAYLDAANRYQSQRSDGDSIARIVGYNAAKYDRITTSYSSAPSAANNLSSFSILKTLTIPHDGVKI